MSAVAEPPRGPPVPALEQAVAAPYRTSRPADAGARVVEIERAGGDVARGDDAVVRGPSGYFVRLNRGEQSLVADPEDPADAALTRDEAAGPPRRVGTACGSVGEVAEFAAHPALPRVEVGTPGRAACVAAPALRPVRASARGPSGGDSKFREGQR